MTAIKPILNVVSTVESERSPELKWHIKNFGLFLNSKASAVYQNFGPLTVSNTQFTLRLSKRKSPQNESDKLELELQKPPNDSHDFTANLKGRISVDGHNEWFSEFVLDFASAKRHSFASPFLSFDSNSTLVIDKMTYEQIVIKTEILNSWVMRLDDSFMMTQSALELSDNEENIIETSGNEKPSESYFSANASQSSSPTMEFEKLDLAFNSDKFELLSNTESSSNPTSVESESEPIQLAKEIEYEEFLVKDMPGFVTVDASTQKKYVNLDDEWLKSLDELLFFSCSPSHMNFESLKTELTSLKGAHRELYKKLQTQFQMFANDCLKGGDFTPEREKFDELDILIVYFKEILKKLAKHQQDFDEGTSVNSEFWPLDDFPDYSQERNWLEENDTEDADKMELLSREIIAHCKYASCYYKIKAQVNQLWTQFTEKSKLDVDQKIQWINSIETKMDSLQEQISQNEAACSVLLVRPVSVEEYGECCCKLAQLQFNLSEMLKKRDDQTLETNKRKNVEDLDILSKLLRDIKRKLVLFSDIYANYESKLRFTDGIKRRLALSKETIKSLDARILEPTESMELDNLKDLYDELFGKMTRFDANVHEYGKYLQFHKAIESICQLHSNISYIMNTADSKTLINYEVELCKCSAELEAGIQTILSDGCQNENFKLQYNDAKTKTDWIAVQLRERLEPWRQFADLFSSIEKSHKSVGELIAQLDAKTDMGYQEICKDIELLESVNIAFEDTRKDINFIRQLCSANQMKSAKLAAEAGQQMQKINEAHNLVENGINTLLFKLRNKTANPFHRHRRGFNRRRHGGSFYDPYN